MRWKRGTVVGHILVSVGVVAPGLVGVVRLLLELLPLVGRHRELERNGFEDLGELLELLLNKRVVLPEFPALILKNKVP